MWMEECIVSLGQAGLSDELEYVTEGIGHVRSSLIMQVKVQIIQVRFHMINESTAIKTHASDEIRS